MTLVINYLEIENFKSYYGKNTLGPFHQSFNAVIGPNGSGKSNVIDSLLFVFGFRAQKIRSKKLSVLIHNSDQHPNVNSCSVTIFFRKIREVPHTTQGGGPVKYEVVPNSDFTVKRTVYKDNSSEYYIDGHKVQYKEVAQLLRDCGVDLDHNRFLILQGEVEQISLLKPKAANEHEEGLLEYLEDIIGTIKYKPMLEEISVDIEKVNEIRTEKNNRVLNLEKDKQALVAPRNAAIAFLKQENQLIEKKNVYFQYRINQTGKNVQEQSESLSGVQEKYDQMEKEIGELNKANEVQSIEWNLKKKECDKKMKQKEKIKARFEEYEKEDVELRESIKHAQESIKKLEKTVDNETQKIEHLRELPEKNEKKIEELKETLEELDEQLEPANKKLQAKMEQVNEETRQYHEKKDALKDKLNELQTKANEAKAKMDLAQTELDVYLNNQNTDKNKLEELRAKIAHATTQVAEREAELKELKTQKIPQWEKEYKKASDEMASLDEQDTKLSEMVKKNRTKFTEAQSSFSSNRNRSRVLNFLMQMQSEGRLSGVYGRLGDLGAIDEKYDVAISTACGALDCIVVENIDTAQKCVESLKANNVGSATFIALDKQDKWRDQVQRKPKTPENVPRLVDLIQPVDPKFMTAFYYSLRNTLVGENLDQATRIAYNASQRNRVVTLKGEIIEVSGTMSGGGQPQKGRMGSRVVSVEAYTADSIKRMQESIQVDENELRKVVERKRQLEPILEDLRTKLEKGRDDLVRWQNELNTLKEQIKVNKATEADLAKRVKESGPGDVGAQRELEQVVEKMREQFEKADKNAAKLREENDSLHNKIVEITKKLLDDPKAHLKRLETTINENKTLMTNLSVEIKTSKRNLANSEKKLASHREDLEQAQSQLAKSQKRLEDIDAEGKEMVEQFDKIKTECDQLEAEVKELVKKMKEEDGKLQKYEKEKIDIKYNLEKMGQELQDENQRLKHFQTALNGLKLHNIDRLMNNMIDEEKEREKYELKKIDEEDFEGLDDDHLKKEIHKLEENLKEQTPNLNIIEKFNEIEKKFMERMEELEKVTEERDALCNKYEEVRKTRFDEFMGGFTKIRLKLKEIYRTVTLEGDAELELVDSMDPFTEGIVLSVRPPKKSWKNVSNLSGGEKTLSSLSLVFALHEFRATPIYVMDEIDAALDFKNVSIIAHYIKERTKNAQFIIISLRNNMFELCDRLFGIYKVKNCTSAAYISPELLELDEKKKQTQSSRNKMAMAATTKSLNQLVGSSNSHEELDNNKKTENENNFVNNENVSMIN